MITKQVLQIKKCVLQFLFLLLRQSENNMAATVLVFVKVKKKKRKTWAWMTMCIIYFNPQLITTLISVLQLLVNFTAA